MAVRRAAVVDGDGYVVNVILVDDALPYPPPPGMRLVPAERPDGTPRRVGPGDRLEGGRFIHVEVLPDQKQRPVVQWVDETGQPVASTAPARLRQPDGAELVVRPGTPVTRIGGRWAIVQEVTQE